MAEHSNASEVCRCGHPRTAHEHFRSGSDCGACGPAECRSFRLDPSAATTRPDQQRAERPLKLAPPAAETG